MTESKLIKGGKLIGIKTSIFTIFNQEKYDPKAIPTAWSEFFTQFRSSNLPSTTIFYGAAIPSMSADIPMDYYAGAIFDIDTECPNGLVSVEIPSGDYLCVTHTGPITSIAETYGRAYGVEFPASGNEMRNAPHLEIYNSDKDPMDADYTLEIAIPIN
jgi:AraC family transcriptional regulator